MFISKLKVTNFKCFKEIDVDLGNVTFIIGPNASGKSSFVDIFRFIRDISEYGLEKAVSLQGGMDFIYNIRSAEGDDINLYYKIESHTELKNDINIVEYETILRKTETETGFEVIKEVQTRPYKNLHCDMSIYNFEPRKSKKQTPVTEESELKENGENLAVILKKILDHGESRKKYLNMVKDILPFIEELNIEDSPRESLILKIRESFNKDKFLPGPYLSDGTVNILSLITALYFEHKKLSVIEEPEKGIHPNLISTLVEMIMDASSEKQIILTTHNSQMVKYAELEDLLLITRDRNGFSTIQRPSRSKEVKTFLSHELGIDDLFIQNLLEE